MLFKTTLLYYIIEINDPSSEFEFLFFDLQLTFCPKLTLHVGRKSGGKQFSLEKISRSESVLLMDADFF